jgi:hypothetical protein
MNPAVDGINPAAKPSLHPWYLEGLSSWLGQHKPLEIRVGGEGHGKTNYQTRL